MAVQENQRIFNMSDMAKFIFVTAFFAIAFIVMTALKVKGFVVWTLFVVVWTLAEMIFARNIHLGAWNWFLIIAGLSVLDGVIIYFLN